MAKRKKRKAKQKTGKWGAANRKTHWKAYKALQMKVDKAWSKLKTDVKRKVKTQTLIRDKNNLLLLLGECNYMARECARIVSRHKKTW
ncbi:MAG TPA: hypothetical protein VLE89_00480 [Chlamydiales bacterium]|nr:hypothetical protein [Chlamydiales bacterium]